MDIIQKELNDYDISSCISIHELIQSSIENKVDTLVRLCDETTYWHITYSRDNISVHYLIGNSRLTYLFDPFNESYSVNLYSPSGNTFLLKRLLNLQELKSYILVMVYYYRKLFSSEEDKSYLNKSIIDLYDNFANKTCLKYMLKL